MSDAELDAKIRDLVDDRLRLVGGEMMLPLKAHEIESFKWAIRDLVDQAVREAIR